MKKIGIMGGSFNPIHFGHLILAENAYEQIGLDSVLFMPLKNPPHKDKKMLVSEDYRVSMVRMAIEDNDKFIFSDMELVRKGTTYTADTLAILAKENPDAQYYFIVGSDSFLYMHEWMKPENIFKLSTILVAGRDLVSDEELDKQLKNLLKNYKAKVIYLDMPSIGISSEHIRDKVINNRSIKYLVPDNVLEFIIDKRLYIIES